mmetsp:Transcript_97891/g.279991  ORF Transcript_97891/g.279991 Transcript_97891/m.279991 type:complete len:717 (+) Transcript_97891:314-2464(+)
MESPNSSTWYPSPASPASGQSYVCRGVPPGWKEPQQVTSRLANLMSLPLALAAAIFMSMMSPVLWVFSFFYDKIMFSFLNKEYIYNVSWEDPRIEQPVFALDRDDHVITIASAGDNALDYIIDNAKVTAVDFNLCQIALTELKVAACRSLPYDEFWKIFAENDIALLNARYATLRPLMRNTSTKFWDDYKNKIKSFQYSGTSGWAAYYLFRWIIPICGLGFLRKCIIKEASQDEIREEINKRRSWIRFCTWFLDNVCLKSCSLLAGVPQEQLQLGLHRKDNFAIIFENVLATDMVNDNYFYAGYILGYYTKKNCPRYLEEANYEKMRANLEEGRLELFHGSIEDRLKICEGEKFTVASLLDHMDWMPADWVQREIAAILRNMDLEKGRIYWRSWSENVHSAPLMWLNPRRVDDTGDRVCMYFSTWIAPLKDTPYVIKDRCHAWGDGYQKPSATQMAVTGAKIVTFPAWKHLTSVRGKDHAAQMELFYKCQKDAYDAFRETLLHARPRLIEYIPLRAEGDMVWVDIGGGTARNLEYMPVETIRAHFKRIYIVDISTSLLSIAKERLAKFGLEDLVTLIEYDVTADDVFTKGLPEVGTADVVTMSYSLSMIPDKPKAIQHALKLCKPAGEGFLGIADFWMRSAFEEEMAFPWKNLREAEAVAHREWFNQDGVHLLPDELVDTELGGKTNLVWNERFRGGVPFIPVLQPYHGVHIVSTI